jgi:hypothetical protein
MTERLRLVGREITIRSRPTRGTQINARVPVAEAVADFETTAAGVGIFRLTGYLDRLARLLRRG